MKDEHPLVTMPDSDDPRIRALWLDYLLGEDDLESLAVRHDLPAKFVTDTAASNKWSEQREQVQEQIVHVYQQRYRRFAAENRMDVAKGHIELTNLLKDQIRRKLTNTKGTGPKERMTLKEIGELSRALKQITDVAGKAVGLHDRGVSTEDLGRTVVLTGTPTKPQKVIEAECVTVDEKPS